MRGVPTLLLTTTGRKSGKPRTIPLVYDEQDGSYVVAASNAGHWEPAWFLNLRDNPDVTVEVGRRRFDATARIAEREEGAALWAGYEQLHPTYAAYPGKRGGIEIPMVILTPTKK
jgi:deazaflavin-dependent oxidoreductase (nitroreductase family)